MHTKVDCPACRKGVTVTLEQIARVMGCPHCASHFMVPREGAAPVPVTTLDATHTGITSIRFSFSCGRCGTLLEGRSNMSGRQGRCPTCGGVFIVPGVDPRTGVPAGPAVIAQDGQFPTPLHAYANAGEKAPRILRNDKDEPIIECPRCRRHMPIEANLCEACGMPFTMEGADAVVEYAGGRSNELASASLAIGALSLLAYCAPGIGIIAILIGVSALRRMEAMGVQPLSRTSAIAGIALGVVSLGWILLWL